MARDIICDLCEKVVADFLVGVISTGDQTGVCARCLPDFTRAVADALDQLDHPPQDAATAPQPPQEGTDGAWTADYPQPALKASRGRKSGPNGQEAEPAETEAPSHVDG